MLFSESSHHLSHDLQRNQDAPRPRNDALRPDAVGYAHGPDAQDYHRARRDKVHHALAFHDSRQPQEPCTGSEHKQARRESTRFGE